MGKTTLASMAPGAVFIGLDDGGRKIFDPKTGKQLQRIPQVVSFQDVRDAVRQPDLFTPGSTIVVDTVTKADELAEGYTLDHVRNDRNETMKSLEEYGFGKGYKHQCETMRLLLADLDGPVARGVNVILLAQQGQATISNLAGTDYSEDGPLLTSQPKAGPNVRGEYCAWVDYIFRIGHPDVSVLKAGKTATKGKVSGSTERVIYTSKQLHYVAKSRPLSDGAKMPEVVSFSSESDDSLWQILFHGARPETEQS